MKRSLVGLALVSGALCAPGPVVPQVPPPPLTAEEAREAREIVEAMKRAERGPYAGIRWYCADGSVHPATGNPCRERGGGVQHADPSPAARRLAALHVHVGTVLQGVVLDSLRDDANANHWLREMVLARYLFEVDDGWVLRRGQFYRGARQIEDEEARGAEVLASLLSDPSWVRGNYLLVYRLVGTLPHPGAGSAARTGRVRNLATEVADLDAGFLPIRIKIHSMPSREDLSRVEEYLARTRPTGALRIKLDSLRAELARQHDPSLGREALQAARRSVDPRLAPAVEAVQGALERGANREALARMATLSAEIRDRVEGSSDGRRNLALLDLNLLLQAQAFLLAQELGPDRRSPESRLVRLRWLIRYFDLAYGAGLLSGRERQALTAEALRLAGAGELPGLEYRSGIRYLARSLEWGWGRVRSVFGLAQQRYLAFEPLAQGFLDAEVRGSVLLPLSGDLTFLAADADAVLGASHQILGEAVAGGVRGLNPGMARGVLDILEPGEEEVESSHIYVLPLTPPELKPVAGVLTLEEGNLLSHVQLLARNLGIPNASVAPELEGRLRAARGEEVLYAVSPLGRVVLDRLAGLDRVEASLLEEPGEGTPEKVRLDTSRLRLERIRPLPLSELRAEASGVFVGPKAANLGQLAAYFPDKVAPGVALPFGMFVRHADRPFESDRTLLEELRDAYGQADRMRSAGVPEADVDAYMFGALERMRRGILELEWDPEVREAIVEAVRQTFGTELGRGVFVRSDTNVEDLPQFSGAGLNLTVAHRRTLEDILASVRQVWTSPFSERAYLWRKQVLEEQGEVYPSVLLLASVPSEKSGVLITTGLEVGGPRALTVVTAEGVGGGVEGEQAETLVVDSAGEVHLLGQALAPRRRVLNDGGAGGVSWRAAAHPDTLLRAEELSQLEAAAREWKTRYARGEPGTVWDMEFGFVQGKLWLFQVRPFVEARNQAQLERLRTLDAEVLRRGTEMVDILKPI